MIAVLQIESFDRFRTAGGAPFRLKTRMVGFLPVYESREDAAKDYPDTPVMVLGVKERERQRKPDAIDEMLKEIKEEADNGE